MKNINLLSKVEVAMRGFIMTIIMGALMLAAWPVTAAEQDGASSTTAPIRQVAKNFDHLKTGFPLTGTHTTVKCETCHKDGVFKGNPKNCAGCHSVGTRVAATPKTTDHIQTTAPCDYCHTSTVTFVGAKFNHTGIFTGCATCHNGVTTKGKSVTHIMTAASCETCHTNKISFTGVALFNHLDNAGAPIISGCATCHNGSTARSKSATHIPTVAPCESCHTSTISFAGGLFDHSAVATMGICGTCHQGQHAAVVSKPVAHIPVTVNGNACDTCHTSTTTFKSWTMNHTGITATCASCHGGQYAGVVSKPAVHIATTAACNTCHTGALTTGGFTTWTMNHTGITTGCASCHGGQYAGLVTKPAVHITTSAACENCHTTTTIPGGFTTWAMSHAGITTGCASCHSGQYAGVMSKPLAHITTPPGPTACESCHTSTTTPGGFATWGMKHTGIITNCTSCHGGQSFNGLIPKNKDVPPLVPPHLVTQEGCENCHHSTTSFTGVVFNHASVTPGTCANCHNGNQAKGKPAGHMVTSLPCDSCHTNTAGYTSFMMTSFNHSVAGIVVGSGTCTNGGCHTNPPTPGKGGAAKQGNHITTTAACDSCHKNTTSFLGASMDHTGITTGCASCHGGQYAGVVSKPTIHITTPAVCETCHSSTVTPGGFATWTMSHSGITTGCASCHGGQYAGVMSKPTAHTTTTAACERCHTSTTTPGGFATWTMSHSGITTGCASCHTGAVVLGVTVVGKTGGHTTTTAPCERCHTSTAPGGFAIWTMSHIGITTGCASCHTGAVVLGVTVVGKPGGHTTTTAACENCHTSTTTPGGFATWRMSHTGITTGCASCHPHSGNTTVLGVTVVGKPAAHITTAAACETCHFSVTTFLGATGGHGNTNAGPCNNCHVGPAGGYGSGGGKAVSVGHIPINSVQCDVCHKSYTSFGPGTTLLAAGHTAVASAGISRCDTCHNGSYTSQSAQAKTSISNHIPTTITGTLDCSTCHTAATATWADVTVSTMNHNNAQTGCIVCHLTGVKYAGGMDKKNHNGSSAAKDCSSSGCHRPLGSKGTPYTKWK